MYPYSELFWSAFSRIQIEYVEILRISPYLIRMQENTDQNNAEYGQILCSGTVKGEESLKSTSCW